MEDNIWTLDGDGELRLTIMATLAQDESRKISERVKAGQQVSRMNKTLYGNGNILGYKRVGNTYVIDPEQAETVRMIYRWYLQGYGMRAIMGKLIENKRRCANGLIKWDTTKVSRVLHNATYMGYIGYNKSYRNNFLDQKIIRNKEEEFVYVKSKCEQEIKELQAAMLGNGQEEGNAEESIDMQYVRDQLGKISITDSGKADKDVLMEFIDTITVEKGNVFRWGLWLRNKPSYLRMTTSGRSDNMTVSAVGAEFDAKECSDNPKTGQNGHFTPAGCDPHRLTLNTRGANGFSPEKPLFTLTIDASIAREYYKRLGVKFFRTRFNPITMVVYIT